MVLAQNVPPLLCVKFSTAASYSLCVTTFSGLSEVSPDDRRDMMGRGDMRNIEDFSDLGGEGDLDLSLVSYRLSRHIVAFLTIVDGSSGLTLKETGKVSPGPKAPCGGLMWT
jgi:hypothetical protein